MLKETVQLTLSTAALAASVQAVRRGGMSRVLYATIIILVLIVLTVMRPGSSAMVAAAIVFGLGMYAATRRAWIAAVAVTVSVAVGALVARSPAVQGWALHQMRLALQRHVGHVNTPGVSYRAADVRFYTSDAAAPLSMTPEEGVRFLLRSTALFFLVPLPSHLASTASWLFVPVNLTWYASLVLAAIGIPAGLKRDALVTLLAIGYVGAGIAVIAPNSGNVGTFVRHRDMVVPFVIGLSAVGALAIVSALMSRRPAWRERLP